MNENAAREIRESDKIQQLNTELEAARETNRRYEALIAQMQIDYKKSLHDLSNPLQILSMTIESLDDKVPAEIRQSLERMKRSAEAMTEIVLAMRKLRQTAEASKQIRTV
jgi:signal transduction histidine kinase